MLKLGVAGVTGRMGGSIVQAIIDDELNELVLSAAIHRLNSDKIGLDVSQAVDIASRVDSLGVTITERAQDSIFDVLIDFSLPDSCLDNVRYCAANNKAVVIGVTGFTDNQLQELTALSERTPIVLAPNMSVGVNLLFHMLKQASSVYGDTADIEIIETHHRDKVDAPSGTALKIGEVIANAQGKSLDQCAVFNRNELREPRHKGSIGFASIRAGDVVGEHTVLFAAEDERLEITHKASNRMTFAKGALRAAGWLNEQPNGLYSMQDVLGLNE
jgi:4-hydroxy-tetrahydrodipicolinate reductase